MSEPTPITPITLTDQEFYDKTIAHLIQQGRRAVGDASATQNGCLYRGPDSTMCAAGCHIPNHLYKPTFEGFLISRLVNEAPELLPYFPNLSLAADLQHLHDSPSNWSGGEDGDAGEEKFIGYIEAAQIAYDFNLTPWPIAPPTEAQS